MDVHCQLSLIFCQNMTARKKRQWCFPVWEVTLLPHSFSRNLAILLWDNFIGWLL